jgi:hypothetical protein
MPKELTESQKIEITLGSVDYSINEMAEKYDVPYNTIYNFCKKHQLKYALTKAHSVQRIKDKTVEVIPYAELLKERAAITPEPKRKWERPATIYSNVNREDLINKILNNGE